MANMRLGLAALCVILSFAAPNLLGQTIAGLVVRGASNTPAGRTVVVLVDDSAKVVSRTQADSTGIFYADAPAPGRYRVVFFPAGGSSFISPPFQLDSGQYVEHEFTVPDIPNGLRDVRFAGDVTTPAKPKLGNRRPMYPTKLAVRGERGLVSAIFVVSEDGKPEMETLQFLSSADSAFTDAVRSAIGHWSFYPAELNGRKVAQVVQETFDFGLPGDPPRGNVVIRTLLENHDGRSH
jgi:hypothetical protein